MLNTDLCPRYVNIRELKTLYPAMATLLPCLLSSWLAAFRIARCEKRMITI